MAHFLDVARLAYIFNLEEHLGIDRERIYAAALLHDIGRHVQYLDGTPHQEAGLPIAGEILRDCGFSEGEEEEILEAIARHRDGSVEGRPPWPGFSTGVTRCPEAVLAAEPGSSAIGARRRKI